MDFFHKKQVIVVTGASSGIGKGTTLLLNQLGATVIAIGRNQERLEAVKSEAINPDTILIEKKDLAEDIPTLPAYMKSLKDNYGKLFGIVFCAGIDSPNALQILNVKQAQDLFNINYLVPLFMAQGFADRRNNVGQGASLVFIASTAAVYPERGQALYAGSKAAIVASAKSISRELAPRGIRCNSISPGYVETPMYRNNLDTIGTDIDQYPLGIGQVEDVAQMTAFLLSDKARWITGQNYMMEGGRF